METIRFRGDSLNGETDALGGECMDTDLKGPPLAVEVMGMFLEM